MAPKVSNSFEKWHTFWRKRHFYIVLQSQIWCKKLLKNFWKFVNKKEAMRFFINGSIKSFGYRSVPQSPLTPYQIYPWFICLLKHGIFLRTLHKCLLCSDRELTNEAYPGVTYFEKESLSWVIQETLKLSLDYSIGVRKTYV